MRRPTPKSLILDLLSTLPRGSAPVRALVEAAALFGIAENALRVALARLLAAGLVERDERGRYRLGAGARAVSRQLGSWRRVEERVVPWGGGWLGVHTGGLSGGSRARGGRSRALRMLGFRPLAPDLEVRPDNLAGGAAGVRHRLGDLGLEPGALVFELASLDAGTEEAARGLWRADALAEGYRTLTRRLRASAARLPELPRDAAMRESFELGGQAIRHIVFDPLLPEPIAPVEERRRFVETARDYDRAGRRCWAGWLGGSVLPERGPAGVGGLDPVVARLRRPAGSD